MNVSEPSGPVSVRLRDADIIVLIRERTDLARAVDGIAYLSPRHQILAVEDRQAGEIAERRRDHRNECRSLRRLSQALAHAQVEADLVELGAAAVEPVLHDVQQPRRADLQPDLLRVTWTNGVPQNRLGVEGNQLIVEEQLLKGSCPFLYTWNGETYVFVTDVLGITPAHGRFFAPDEDATLEEMDLEESLAFYRERFADAGDFTFVFVGSFDPEELRPLVESYVASLPTTGRTEAGRDVGIEAPRGVIRRDVRRGMRVISAQVRPDRYGVTRSLVERMTRVGGHGTALLVEPLTPGRILGATNVLDHGEVAQAQNPARPASPVGHGRPDLQPSVSREARATSLACSRASSDDTSALCGTLMAPKHRLEKRRCRFEKTFGPATTVKRSASALAPNRRATRSSNPARRWCCG